MEFITRFPYLTPKSRECLLSKYKYVGTDDSFFSRILNPFWEVCANALPKSMAPNTVTSLGFIGVLVAVGTVLFYNPTLNGGSQTSPWVYLLAAFLLFYYQTMDAIDGKHARNTKSSSALGELFDHGLDALTTMCQTLIIVSTLQLGPTYWSVACMFLIYVTSYLVIWEDYVTDELRFGLFNSPTEAILLAVAICVFTAIFGHGIWEFSFFSFSFNHVVVTGCICLAISVIYQSIITVLAKAKSGKNERAVDIGSTTGAVKALIPFIVQLVLYVVYALAAPVLVRSQIVAFTVAFGLIASYLQTRMIFARVCRDVVPVFPAIMYLLPVVVLNALGPRIAVRLVDYIHLTYICLCYAHFVYNVINEMTLVLGIECFTMKKHTKVPEGFATARTNKRD